MLYGRGKTLKKFISILKIIVKNINLYILMAITNTTWAKDVAKTRQVPLNVRGSFPCTSYRIWLNVV